MNYQVLKYIQGMNPYQQFESLGRKQATMQDTISMLQQSLTELQQVKAGADFWGMVAIVSNAALMPLNCIINAFELGAAQSVYQSLVRAVYDKFSKSGSRTDGTIKTAVEVVKNATIAALKSKGLTVYVPGVNILAGLAQDSMALLQAAQTVQKGNAEINSIKATLQQKIMAIQRELLQTGILRNQMLEKIERISRTA